MPTLALHEAIFGEGYKEDTTLELLTKLEKEVLKVVPAILNAPTGRLRWTTTSIGQDKFKSLEKLSWNRTWTSELQGYKIRVHVGYNFTPSKYRRGRRRGGRGYTIPSRNVVSLSVVTATTDSNYHILASASQSVNPFELDIPAKLNSLLDDIVQNLQSSSRQFPPEHPPK
jgi:hypothetical protein